MSVVRNSAAPAESADRQAAAGRNSASQKLLRRLLRISLEYSRPCLVVVLLQSLMVALGLATLGLTGLSIDFLRATLISGAEQPSWPFGLRPPESWSPMSVIQLLAGTILVVAVLTAIVKYLAAMASAALSQEVLIRIRTDVYSKLQQLSFQFYDGGESSSIINRAAGDANAVRSFIDGVVIRVLTVGLTLAVYLAYMIHMHAWLTLVCLASTPILWAGAAVFSRV
ncbi:MAG: ABC transporter ATP-binding protein, partial [Planctomyces sp.]